MKLSGHHKRMGDHVELLTSYELLGWDLVYVSKVFTDTEVPGEVLAAPNVVYGGTGFYYDKAPDLPDEVEHGFPDYHLYDGVCDGKYYTDYSIGYLTRGCFRKCEFCVNKKYDRCTAHSPLEEFMDPDRPKLCFLDDNFFACPQWRELIRPVVESGKRFQFKQGLDERLLTDEKIHAMMSWKYDGDFTFAFDDIKDRDLIEKKLKRIRELYPNMGRNLRFFVFCGYNNAGGQISRLFSSGAEFCGGTVLFRTSCDTKRCMRAGGAGCTQTWQHGAINRHSSGRRRSVNSA